MQLRDLPDLADRKGMLVRRSPIGNASRLLERDWRGLTGKLAVAQAAQKKVGLRYLMIHGSDLHARLCGETQNTKGDVGVEALLMSQARDTGIYIQG